MIIINVSEHISMLVTWALNCFIYGWVGGEIPFINATTRTLLKKGVTMQALVKPWTVSTCCPNAMIGIIKIWLGTPMQRKVFIWGILWLGTHRLVECKRLLVPPEFLSRVQVQAVLWKRSYSFDLLQQSSRIKIHQWQVLSNIHHIEPPAAFNCR